MNLWSRQARAEREKRITRGCEYIDLITAFLSGRVTGPEFKTGYLGMRTADITSAGDLPCRALDDLFWHVEDFEADDDLRPGDPNWIDEVEFKRRVAASLAVVQKELGIDA
jgi:hypothetical protein